MNTLPDPAGDRQPDAGGTENLRPLLVAVLVITSAGIGCGRRPPQDGTIDSRQPLNSATSNAGQQIEADVTAVFSELASELTSTVIARTGTGSPRNTILESLGSGVAVLDYDRDGDGDVFVLGGGSFDSSGEPIGLGPTLLENDGQGGFTDATAAAAIEPPDFYSHSVCVFDWDGDDLPDMLVTGFRGCLLYHNQRDGRFTAITATELGIIADTWFTSAASADFNADGLVDLYLATYVDWSPANDPPCLISGRRDVCPPAQFNALPDRIYLGTKDGVFKLATGPFRPSLSGKGLGVIAADFDLDGDTDIYVANDTTPNALYENHRNERLVEVGLYSGTSLGLTGAADGSMGVDAADTDGDGLPDLWVTNFERESFGLYRNAGDLLFQNVSLPTGIGRLARSYVGFGTAFLDLDANGFEDLFATNGHVMFQPRNAPRKQQPILLHNESGTRFRNIAATAGHYFSAAHTGRGTAIGDLDGDGDQDLAITHADEPLALLRNDGQPARVLRLRLVGTTSHRDAVGAIATLQTSKRQLIRLVKGGGSYLSASEKTICFLLPAAEQPKTLAIRWPAGSRSEYAISPDGGFFTATEGEDALQVTAGATR